MTIVRDPHLLVVDGYNLLHRSRSGFIKGEYAIVFNFFRALRCEVEKHNPSRIIFVTEGTPKRQLAIDPEYKGNRVIEPGTQKEDKFLDFLRQKEIIIELMKRSFPISIMRHPDFEADDTVYNIIKNSSRAIPVTVISTDTDFIQLLNCFDNVKVYDPVKKKYQEETPYPYVCWKALRGDPSDNIPKIPGMSDAKAIAVVKEAKNLNDFLKENPHYFKQYMMNFDMIKFKDFSVEETFEVTSSMGLQSWDVIKNAFELFGFKSMVNEKSWNKFVNTFDPLF